MAASRWRTVAPLLFAIAAPLAGNVVGCGASTGKAVKLASDDERVLRPRSADAGTTSGGHPLLVLALDGIDRTTLYEMLRAGQLPQMSDLLGGRTEAGLPHAYLEEQMLSVVPSTTMVAWATALTGVPPAAHGLLGNEFFIREKRRFAAPAAVSFADDSALLDSYNTDYADGLLDAPTVFQRLREREPDIDIWVGMQHLHGGADRLLRPSGRVLTGSLLAAAKHAVKGRATRDLYASIDESGVAAVVRALASGHLPDVLHVYLSGADLYAHIAEEGPDIARRKYLVEIIDPLIAKLVRALDARRARDGRYVVVTADHGHTQVLYDEVHSLGANHDKGPPGVLRAAGFRTRPFKLDVDANDDFQSVVAYQGAIAYVYVADRSTCADKGHACDWSRPPRFTEDVLAAAEAFRQADLGGGLPTMKGTLDLVLARKPKPWAEDDLPFEVYVGDGKLVDVATYLADHPHPTYVALAERLRDLAVGKHGERAGDLLLVAHNGDRDQLADRYYFAAKYHSWHGSPSKSDSEIPFIVSRPDLSTEMLHAEVAPVLGAAPRQASLTEVLLHLRAAR
ncbi:MAG: hypothetical protein JWM74_478 [Myxococcaceae bacterium]|nr:hypothetical protein [Myxococcaceae bacterium]